MTLPVLPVASTQKPARLTSLDAYRGFIMLAMASGGFAFGSLATAVVKKTTSSGVESLEPPFPCQRFWEFLAVQFNHVEWTGCVFWDLIQPSFMFMVGVAIPYSHASRKAKGDSDARIFGHVVLRSVILILLGIFLSSNGSKHTEYTFVNVLTQIGLGYAFVYLLLGKGFTVQLAAALAILVGYWLLFATYPLPDPDFNYEAVKTGAGERFSGWFAHWDKNANAAAAFDLWFLNLFPRATTFRFNSGGYQTLNFVPSMATMIFGLMAGELLRGPRNATDKFLWLIGAALLCLGLGMVVGLTWCPLVKRIWTPSWAVYSTGWTFAMLALFYGLIDILGWRWWAFPLVVVGMNSITMYCMAQLLKPWTRQTLRTHFGQDLFPGAYGPLAESVAVLFVLWLICLWLYRQKIFVRI